jgi:hypothetical protein
MDEADAQPFVEAGALKPLGLSPEAKANVPQVSSSEPASDSLLPEKSELDSSADAGGGLMTPSKEPSGETAGELTTQGIQAAKDALENDPSKADVATTEEVTPEPVQQTTGEATTETAAEGEGDTETETEAQAETESSTDATEVETETEPAAESQTETEEVTEADERDTVTYEVQIDDPDGAYTSWFNELAASKGIGVTFEASSGRPRVELPADLDSETLNGWVAAFRAAYPDFASVTAAPVQ